MYVLNYDAKSNIHAARHKPTSLAELSSDDDSMIGDSDEEEEVTREHVDD
jgi:hypothetical protein